MMTQISPNRWSCLPTSFAIALDIPVKEIIERIGHDGSEVVWPQLPEPKCRRCFHIQELIYVSWKLGFSVTPFEPMPQLQGCESVQPIRVDPPVKELANVLEASPGVITGKTLRGQPHAVAWDRSSCYDPNGTIYKLENFYLGCFWAIKSR